MPTKASQYDWGIRENGESGRPSLSLLHELRSLCDCSGLVASVIPLRQTAVDQLPQWSLELRGFSLEDGSATLSQRVCGCISYDCACKGDCR